MYKFLFLSITLTILFYKHAQAQSAPEWSYDGLRDGQNNWSMLSADYALCEAGLMQSPVVISHTKSALLPPLQFNYRLVNVKVHATKQFMRIEFEPGNTLVFGETRYNLIAAEFHSPSEHVVRDTFYPLEIRLLHEDEKGQRLHLAIFVDSGGENSGVEPLITALPQFILTSTDTKFDPSKLLPSSLGYFSYIGSQTYPPCKEGVEWRVLKNSIQFSGAQLQAITKLHGRSARLEQPIYNRVIYETNE
jgi:carbonic anhydrase